MTGAVGTRPILVVDNHDSFVHTLVGYLHELGADTVLVEADDIDPNSLEALITAYDGILISPGPGAPGEVGASGFLVRAGAAAGVPVLGVCLGHQVIAEAFGATVAEAPELFHGVTSPVVHDGSMLFVGVPTPFVANRYHSLAIVPHTLPPDIHVTARTSSGVVMAIAHHALPVWGVQFHPESVLTESGYRLLANWLDRVGVPGAVERSRGLKPHAS